MAKRIMISGALGGPVLGYGGNTWAFLQYILGFRRLGFETYYVEHLSPNDCIDEDWQPVPLAASANARYFRSLMDRFGLNGSMALLEWEGVGHIGLTHTEVEKLAPDIDLLVNLSGHLHLKSVLSKVRRRLYLDLDPGYTQIWQEQYGVDMNLPGHDVYVTVGLQLGKPACPLPTCGIPWKNTLPPVVLSEWTTAAPPGVAYSTIADWRGFGPVEWDGVWYGQKADEFLRVIDLPRRLSVPLEICLLIGPDEPDRVTLEAHGWRLVSPRLHVATPDSYRDYIFGARGEFTCVKHAYAAGCTGWFSDRSACYLAAGRPVITQETGFTKIYGQHGGLFGFRKLSEIAEAVREINADYRRHSAAAREIGREFFEAEKVLASLLDRAGL